MPVGQQVANTVWLTEKQSWLRRRVGHYFSAMVGYKGWEVTKETHNHNIANLYPSTYIFRHGSQWSLGQLQIYQCNLQDDNQPTNQPTFWPLVRDYGLQYYLVSSNLTQYTYREGKISIGAQVSGLLGAQLNQLRKSQNSKVLHFVVLRKQVGLTPSVEHMVASLGSQYRSSVHICCPKAI